MGDGLLAIFDHASDAISFATALHRFFKDRQESTGGTLSFRMSIHAGTVLLIDAPYGQDIVGEPVAVAARLNNVAGPNEIVISAAAMSDLSREQIALLGPRETTAVKGFRDPIEVRRFNLDAKAIS